MVSRQTALDDPDMEKFLEENPVYKATYDQIDEMVPWFNFPGEGGTRVQKMCRRSLRTRFRPRCRARRTPEDAMKEAAKQANALIQ
ncbi:hypothetical protein [Cohnella massiliensis]|uniref:hypothetical protein n=1 Tax=Cohnella massiliensis TaxID=1816691 RepID=UPI0009BBEBA7|nr:hypothetical protein [Cohnella massiliensis]